MTSYYPGSGDPLRSMELLWDLQDKPKRGPKPRFTVGEIVDVAIAIADAEGLAALTMRRVAAELGVTAMSLYGYVPGKAELIDVMADRVHEEFATPSEPPEGWRARLEVVARRTWALYVRHPWLLQVSTTRPALGPNVIAKYDHDLRAVAGLGLSSVEMDLIVTLVGNYVQGAVRAMVEAAQVEQTTGMDDAEWWEKFEPLLARVFDGDRYPVAAVVGAEVGQEYGGAAVPERAFEFGLSRLLDGVAVLVERA